MQHLFPSTWKPCNITYYPSGISKDSCHPHSRAGLHWLSLLCASTSHLRQPFNNTVSQVKPQANVPVSSWAAADYVECLSFAIWTLVRCCKAPLFTTGWAMTLHRVTVSDMITVFTPTATTANFNIDKTNSSTHRTVHPHSRWTGLGCSRGHVPEVGVQRSAHRWWQSFAEAAGAADWSCKSHCPDHRAGTMRDR